MADAFPISGPVDPKTFPSLVVQLHRSGATGSLKVEGPSYHKALYFRTGRVLFGSSNDPRDQLGSILIEAGKITPEQLEDVNAKVGPGNPLAKVLSDTGFVSQRELSEAARAKVERILSDVLAYATGSFDFEDGVLPKGAVDLKLSTERLVMSAVRRVSDRNFVLRHIGGLDAVLGPTGEMVPRLGDIEAETGGLPQQLDGRRTLKEAAEHARLDEFEAAKIACGLLFLGLVERVHVGVTAAAAVPASFEEADEGSELDLGATAAQAFAPGTDAAGTARRAAEPEPSITPADDGEPPPFVVTSESMSESMPAHAVSTPEPLFGAEAEPEPEARAEPEPEPEPPAPSYAEPPVPVEAVAPPAPDVHPETAVPAMAAEVSEPPSARESPPPPPPPATIAGEVPPPPVTASASGLPLIMPEKRTSIRRSSPPARAEAEIRPARPSRPSKEDLAALDELLNTKGSEGPLTPLEKPGRTGPIPPMASARGGRRSGAGGPPVAVLGGAALLLLLAAGAWFYRDRLPLPGRATEAPATPGPVASIPAVTPPSAEPSADESPIVAAGSPAAAVPSAVPAPASPAPSPRTPPTAASRAGAPDGRALMRAGSYAEAARAFASSTRAAGRDAAVIQLLIACSTETVQKAVDNADAPELLILPVRFQGRDCYRLGWGVYPTSAKATAALRSIPEYFRQGGAAPRVLRASEAAP